MIGVNNMARKKETDVTQNPLYHDTWKLLKKYRDVVWSMELSVQQVHNQFQIEYGKSIEDFLDSIYLAGADLSGTDIEHHARCIQRSAHMIQLVDEAMELMRKKHTEGEDLYWILYYTFIVSPKLRNTEQIIDKLKGHIRDISYRTYFRRRQYAVEVLSSVLWGYSARDSKHILDQFCPQKTQYIDKMGIDKHNI